MMESIIDTLTNYAMLTDSPFLMVFLLALVFAFDPCAILTNIAAIGYISKDIENKNIALKKGLWYTLGRTIAYGLLGLTLIILIQLGKNIIPINHFIEEYGKIILIPFMIIVGILLCISDYLPTFNINLSANKMTNRAKSGYFGAFLLGALLSLAFCPTNAMLFFGMMVPISAAHYHGYILPFLFAATTAIPVIIISYLLAFSLQSIGKYYNKLKTIGIYIRWIVGIIFLLIGIFFAIELAFNKDVHHHHHIQIEQNRID